MTTGAEVTARTLKSLGVEVIFGIVGIPVLAEACIAAGIQFIGFRNEQSASYAACCYGYLSGKPGVCLTVGGPGVVHGLAGVANAQVNHWPMLHIAGSCDTDQVGMGAFQELDQVEVTRPYTKYSGRPIAIKQIPFFLETAYKTAFYGRPGPTYIDIPGDLIQGQFSGNVPIPKALPPPPAVLADPNAIHAALQLLQNAEKPLVIVGKGASYACADEEILEFVQASNIPFLPTPMGKGLIPDAHELCVAAARSKALKEADVILLIGARLNWILHFGGAPRVNAKAKIIQIDIAAEEIHRNARVDVALVGHIPNVLHQLNTSTQPSLPKLNASTSSWLKELTQKVKENQEKTEKQCYPQESAQDAASKALNYHTAFGVIKRALPMNTDQVVIVSEGANTMDIARSVFDVAAGRLRVDAGTFATMGVGMGFAIAAQIYYPSKRIVSITGDSAFGFSAMELETAARAGLPLLIIVINNNGIYHGLTDSDFSKAVKDNNLPSTALLPDTRYDMIAEACGGRGWFARNKPELEKALKEAWAEKTKPCVINVAIVPGGRKKLEFAWQNKSEAKL
ncbi:hypothetical protein BZG36_04295 [Bifiguratus adelaidae]|uniref:2-hydroxyacyl-CoA lyase n=1 Tax=Bifiguratus adelaidae TaxID=1938954 RepID=A0A261XVF5_9FUNG|nr:hypothetical protein BZG36_04295 [Bifiguratus adelaidae]